MKLDTTKNFVKYLYENFIANFLGFLIGVLATRLVSHFFVTRSIKNLWGLTARKTVIDKSNFNNLEMFISVVIGFVVFEVLSKWIKKKMEAAYPASKNAVLEWMGKVQ